MEWEGPSDRTLPGGYNPSLEGCSALYLFCVLLRGRDGGPGDKMSERAPGMSVLCKLDMSGLEKIFECCNYWKLGL